MIYLKSKRFLALLYQVTTLLLLCMTIWSAQMQKPSSAVNQQPSGKTENAYYVREYDERVAVFDLSGNLSFVADIYLVNLPLADREMLENGIFIKDTETLLALMEDYTG